MRSILFLLALVASSVPALAQGSDSCQTATPITGSGPFAFDNTAASGGLNFVMCAGASRDVWFRWTAPAAGIYAASTCGGTTLDTVLALYSNDSGCPFSDAAMSCNDNACGPQSSVTFHADAGEVFTIQIATRTSPGAGTFTVAPSTSCATSVGADLVVGAIHEVTNYNASGGVDAIALGVAVCNDGDATIEFYPALGRHPVVATNLYRHRVESGSGRFEQIGMSWLFHAWGAADGTLCCAQCAATSSTLALGAGCSTGHSAADAGWQAELGPRREVDAWTGAYAYPPSSPPWSGSTARRLQYLSADVSTAPGERYFAEAQYVEADELASNHQDNDAGWCPLSPTATGFNLVGPTFGSAAAIEAWATCETGVSIVEARVPGEGLFHVGCKVTDLGGGQWHYEYAVHNQNSHRSGGSFSVPIGLANVTNVGFHDVEYRNGDGEGNVSQSGLDWSVTNAGGVLTWATETQAANANANALRWSTTYNFRFDADVPPSVGSATIGLWRAGGPASIDAAAQVPRNAIAFCSGDGSGTPCPCANAGASGNGCANSVDSFGANLAASGVASVANDTLVLVGNGMPNSSALYFQGTAQAGAGLGTVFGDGLRCAGGATVRLATKTNANGTSTYPVAGDLSISVRGGALAGDVRTYQCWYRNAAAFCTASTFNLTNGLQLVWGA